MITSINTKRKRFPRRIEIAFKCFKLKTQLRNGRSPTNEQISHMMEEEVVEVPRIKRYRREIRTLVENGCPW